MEETLKRLSTKFTDSAYEYTTKLTNTTVSAVKASSLANLSTSLLGINTKYRIGNITVDTRDYENPGKSSTIIHDLSDPVYQCILEMEDVMIGFILYKQKNLENIVNILTERIFTYHNTVLTNASSPNYN